MAQLPDLRYIVEMRPEAEVLAERAAAEAWRVLRPLLVTAYNEYADTFRAAAKACAETAQMLADLDPAIPNPARPHRTKLEASRRSYAIGDRVRVTANGVYYGAVGTVRAYGRASRCYSVRLHSHSETKTFSSAELEHEVMFP